MNLILRPFLPESEKLQCIHMCDARARADGRARRVQSSVATFRERIFSLLFSSPCSLFPLADFGNLIPVLSFEFHRTKGGCFWFLSAFCFTGHARTAPSLLRLFVWFQAWPVSWCSCSYCCRYISLSLLSRPGAHTFSCVCSLLIFPGAHAQLHSTSPSCQRLMLLPPNCLFINASLICSARRENLKSNNVFILVFNFFRVLLMEKYVLHHRWIFTVKYLHVCVQELA